MYTFEKNKPLSTTFNIPANAALYAEYKNVDQLRAITLSEEYLQNEVHTEARSGIFFVFLVF